MSNDIRPKRVRPLPRTPVALSVLNLLNERPMHPYEMRTRMRERGHDRAFKIRESSVYDTVTRLAERGFIEPVDVNREGRRPERTVYAITEAGRDELLVWMWELASEPPAEAPAFAAPLMFIYSLGQDRTMAAFQQRAARLEADISSSDAYRRAFVADMPGFVRDLRHRGGVHPGDAQSGARLAAGHAGRVAGRHLPVADPGPARGGRLHELTKRKAVSGAATPETARGIHERGLADTRGLGIFEDMPVGRA